MLKTRWLAHLREGIKRDVDASGLTGNVFDVVSLVKDDDAVLEVDVHAGADNGVDKIVIGAEHQICLVSEGSSSIVGARTPLGTRFH